MPRSETTNEKPIQKENLNHMKKFVFAFATFALAAASAAEKHTVQFYTPTIIGGQELKAGEYKLVLDGAKLIIKDGKRLIETDVKVENESAKYLNTSVRYVNGKQASEIRFGGSTTKLVLGAPGARAN